VAGDAEPKLYREFASWFYLLTAPEEYSEEAATYLRLIRQFSEVEPSTLLELGSGGGNNASHLKSSLSLTLTDLSDEMLELSRNLNTECEHIQGDMRDLRLGRMFDAVLLHDAIDYMTSERDLAKAIATAAAHCRAGGVALFVPDYVTETFTQVTDHGGNDGRGRALRYLEWSWDPDPNDTAYFMDLTYVLRAEDGEVKVVHDRHNCGLFPRATWLRLMDEAGFVPSIAEADHSESQGTEIFVGRRKPDTKS